MTHPALGYTNFRFDSDDAVHMAAFNGAGHVIACNAEGPTKHDLWPHGVDAPVDCENCLRAREADWWMAQAEQQRREGAEAVWPEATLDDVKDIAARLVSQVDAKVETAILWGDGDNAPPITVQTSDDYFFGQDKMAIKARQGDQKTYRTVDHVSQRSPEELNEAVAATLHQLDRERVPEEALTLPPDIDTLPEPANWCHVHNRTTEAGREECSECDGERGEDRKAGES